MAALMNVLKDEIRRVGVATVAIRAGLSRQHLYKILAGASNPTSEHLEALSSAVSCNVNISQSKYYPANPSKEHAVDLLVEIIIDLYDPQEIWLFGSQSRGDWLPDSDIDLLIVGRKERSPKRGEIYVQAAKRKIRDGFDAVFVTAAEFARHRNDEQAISGLAAKEGRRLHDRSLKLKSAVAR